MHFWVFIMIFNLKGIISLLWPYVDHPIDQSLPSDHKEVAIMYEKKGYLIVFFIRINLSDDDWQHPF